MPPAKSRIPNQFPRDPALGGDSLQVLDAMLVNINNLLTQGPPPPGQGIGAFGMNIINPTGTQITSVGSRVGSITSSLTAIATPTQVAIYWDGTNGSTAFKIYRDDGSIFGPFITGSPQIVTGLTNNTNYFFYPFFDDIKRIIGFANVPGVSVGSPAIAFTAQSILANQQQILSGHIPLALQLVTTGITVPSSASNTVKSPGGGGVGGGYGGKNLQ